MELEGDLRARQSQTKADFDALREAGVDGLALSLDLLHIPLELLSLVKRVYGQE